MVIEKIELETQVELNIPGAVKRFGIYKEDLPFDDFCRILVVEEANKKGKVKVLTDDQMYDYIARRKYVLEVK